MGRLETGELDLWKWETWAVDLDKENMHTCPRTHILTSAFHRFEEWVGSSAGYFLCNKREWVLRHAVYFLANGRKRRKIVRRSSFRGRYCGFESLLSIKPKTTPGDFSDSRRQRGSNQWSQPHAGVKTCVGLSLAHLIYHVEGDNALLPSLSLSRNVCFFCLILNNSRESYTFNFGVWELKLTLYNSCVCSTHSGSKVHNLFFYSWWW